MVFWIWETLICLAAFQISGIFHSSEHYRELFVLTMLIWFCLSYIVRIDIPRFNRKREMLKSTIANIYFFIVVLVLASIISPTQRKFFTMTVALNFIFSILNRILVCYMLRYRQRRGYDKTHIVVVGSSEDASRYSELIENNLTTVRVVSEEDWDKVSWNLSNQVTDEIHLINPNPTLASKVSSACEQTGITLKMPLVSLNGIGSKVYLEKSKTTVSLVVSYSIKRELGVVVKRIIDVLMSFLIGCLTLVPALAIMLLLKVTSKGPIFFKQKRVGINGRKFTVYKFRTMIEESERLKHVLKKDAYRNKPFFKLKQDPRVTSVGKFLRKFSLDELPQLLNVLKGDMSLVGPRPWIEEEYVKLTEYEKSRIRMKPGLTGLWQISGRGDLDPQKIMELDVQYVRNWSLLLDFKILIRTIPAVCIAKGAY